DTAAVTERWARGQRGSRASAGAPAVGSGCARHGDAESWVACADRPDCHLRRIRAGCRNDNTRRGKRPDLVRARLWVTIRANHRSDHQWAAVAPGEDSSHMACGIEMSAIPEDDIKQDNAYLGIANSFGERTFAHGGLNNRMWASAGEFVVAEIHHDVAALPPMQRGCAWHRLVGCHRKMCLPEHDLGLGAKRPAREQSAHQLAPIRAPRWRLELILRQGSSKANFGSRLEGRG